MPHLAPGLLLALTLLQQPAPAPVPELAVIDAKLGGCSADFTVKDATGKPVYNAVVHVRIRYGLMGVKRMDLEVGTNSDGQARVVGLPTKARPLVFDISKGDTKASVTQDLNASCQATHEVGLK